MGFRNFRGKFRREIVNKFEWEEKLKITENFLDTKDLRKYLRTGKDVYDIMEEVQNDFSQEVKSDPFFDGDVFYYMDVYEFCQYIERRYDIKVRIEEITSYTVGRVPWN